MDEGHVAKLREPFPAERIGKLPRITCGACRDARGRACSQHPKIQCDQCKQWITPSHMHLDYVGHSDVTDRLLHVDPEWTWAPLASTEQGLPLFDENGGIWIRLTVAGVTRIGYGDGDGRRGPDAVKIAIGDALRNAAMRFGVALDLWRKGELEPPDHTPTNRAPDAQRTTAAAAAVVIYDKFLRDIKAANDPATINAIGIKVNTALNEGKIAQGQFASLSAEARKRLGELDQ